MKIFNNNNNEDKMINITELEEKVIIQIGGTIDGVNVDAPDTTEEDLQEFAVASERWKFLVRDTKISPKVLRGVLASLTKKGLIEVDESSTDKHSWGENFQDPLIHFTPNGISFWWNNIHNKESA